MVMYALIDRHAHPQHSRSALLRCAVLAYWFDNGFSRMLVRVPVRGMQVLFELQRNRKYILLIFTRAGRWGAGKRSNSNGVNLHRYRHAHDEPAPFAGLALDVDHPVMRFYDLEHQRQAEARSFYAVGVSF